MGIVLKRRDNGPIVKIVCGGIIDKILNEKSVLGAVEFVRSELKKILKEVYELNIDNNNTKTVNKSLKLVHEMPLLFKNSKHI